MVISPTGLPAGPCWTGMLADMTSESTAYPPSWTRIGTPRTKRRKSSGFLERAIAAWIGMRIEASNWAWETSSRAATWRISTFSLGTTRLPA